jgi:predicted Zn-dependent protease with MMP-like domain
MLHVSDEDFEVMVAEAIGKLPESRIKGLQNVAIVYADTPTNEQRKKLKLRGSQSLYGLYEGIPLTKRAAASSLFSDNPMTLPDVITIFKKPILANSDSMQEAREQVNKTLWHEIAHYYGLDHEQIDKLGG